MPRSLDARDRGGDPLDALKGARVADANVSGGKLTLQLAGRSGEVLVEVPGRCELTAGPRRLTDDAPDFAPAVVGLVGAKVKAATLEVGRAVVLDLAPSARLTVSLAEGDYPGTHALYIRGPGTSYVSYHSDGITRLSL